jgi:hypothetical protein
MLEFVVKDISWYVILQTRGGPAIRCCRTGAGGQRREQNGPNVHRRSLRRMAPGTLVTPRLLQRLPGIFRRRDGVSEGKTCDPCARKCLTLKFPTKCPHDSPRKTTMDRFVSVSIFRFT